MIARQVVVALGWKDQISTDPNVCYGRPYIKGTRVWVSLIVDNLAAGVEREKLRNPTLP